MQDTTTVACEPAAGGENTVLKDPRQNSRRTAATDGTRGRPRLLRK